MGELKRKEMVLTDQQIRLEEKINRLATLNRKGKLGKTGHENLKKYRDMLESTGYNWHQGEIEPTCYLIHVVERGRRRWVKH